MAVVTEKGRALYPVVVQNRITLQILMQAFADQEALDLTRKTGFAHFYSRSRQALWKKGETSGHTLEVVSIMPDCDQDSFLYLVETDHPACHRNVASCFDHSPKVSEDPLVTLDRIVRDRLSQGNLEASYTAQMTHGPLERLLKKVGEEAIEVIVAARTSDGSQHDNMIWETTDLLYHLTVLLNRMGVTLDELLPEIRRRHTR